MKKTIAFIVAIVAIAVLFPLSYHYVHKHLIHKAEIAAEKAKEVKIEKKIPHNYCLITYNKSTDAGKTWMNVILHSGQKPIYKNNCWKKYEKLIAKFSDARDTNGNWYGRDKNGDILAQPYMRLSPTIFTNDKEIASKAFTEFKRTAKPILETKAKSNQVDTTADTTADIQPTTQPTTQPTKA